MICLDLFAGIGGFSLAAEWCGWTTAAFVEKDVFCQKVLRKNFGDHIEIYDDIQTFSGKPFRGRVDIVTGGFPCQDISIAGKHAGITGERSALWSELYRIICEVRPRYVVVENVNELLRRGMDRVLADLSTARYDAEWGTFCGYHVGLPQEGKRIFIIATPQDERREHAVDAPRQSVARWRFLEKISASGNVAEFKERFVGEVRSAEFVRTANGLPDRMDRIKALGNSIVPQIAFGIFKAIEAADAA